MHLLSQWNICMHTYTYTYCPQATLRNAHRFALSISMGKAGTQDCILPLSPSPALVLWMGIRSPAALPAPRSLLFAGSLSLWCSLCSDGEGSDSWNRVPLIGLRQPDDFFCFPGQRQIALIGGSHASLRKLVFVAPSGCQNKPERFIPKRKLSEKPDSFTGNKSLRGWYILSTFSFHS